jgi:probable phosphoglycerate mutase
MDRTIETATIVGAAHNIKPQTCDGLREIDHGHWEGLTRKEVNEKYPDEIAMWDDDPFGYTPPGGETGMAVVARAVPVMREIVTAHPNGSVYVVSHKATNRLIIGHYLGIELRGYRDRLDQQPACLNILDFRDAGRARLMLLNDISHYNDQPENEHIHLSGWWSK